MKSINSLYEAGIATNHGQLTTNNLSFSIRLILMGIIEVDLFSEDVNSQDHPEALEFKKLLEEVAADYNCHLLSFDIDHGTVIFSFDNDELTAEVLRILHTRAPTPHI